MISNLKIAGLQKMSLLDYPEKICATVFLGGCNFRCPFCHNASLALPYRERPEIPDEELFELLSRRKGLLDGVCVSGGEPLLQRGTGELIKKIKSMGFAVKLDTNGYFPHQLKELVSEGLVDYVAMDIKNSPEKYPLTIGLPDCDISPIIDSAAFLMSCGVAYEFRTTCVKELHCEDDFVKIGEWLRGADKYFLQQFMDSGDLIEDGLHGFTPEEMERLAAAASPYFSKVSVRGL